MSRATQLLVIAGVASAQITLDGVKCGKLKCLFNEYCSLDTNKCAPCNIICNNTHHNYDAGLCVKECQGYLLDLRYLNGRGDASVSGDYASVQRQAQTALIISVVALAVLVITLIIVCRGSRFSWSYLKKKFQPAKNRVNNHHAGITHHNPHAEMARAKPEMKLEIRNPDRTQPLNVRDLDTRTQADKSQGATTPKTISTAISNRHPAEDTTLDFSYDNRALNVTPSEQTQTNRF